MKPISVLKQEDIDFINRISKKIYSSGFITPSVLFLESIKPLSSLGSHLMVFLGPVICSFVNSDGYYRAAELIQNSDVIEMILVEVERLNELESQNQ